MDSPAQVNGRSKTEPSPLCSIRRRFLIAWLYQTAEKAYCGFAAGWPCTVPGVADALPASSESSSWQEWPFTE